MNRRIVFVEDSQEYQELVRSALSGFNLEICGSLAEAKTVLWDVTKPADFVILDVSLPDGNGISFLSELRSQSYLAEVPIFILSADGAIGNKVAAFGVGVEDYICKPFSALEFRARVEARLKRADEAKVKVSQREVGDLILDQSRLQVRYRDRQREKIDLTPIEFKILFFLARRSEVAHSRQDIIDEVWGPGTFLTDRTVDAHVSHLRRKLEDSLVTVSTILGTGYQLAVKV